MNGNSHIILPLTSLLAVIPSLLVKVCFIHKEIYEKKLADGCDAPQQRECNGLPKYILPNNSTGHLAFPEANFDPIGGEWQDVQEYPGSVTCTWILKAPPLHVFYLKILHFNTEENFDYVKLYSSEDRSEMLFQFSGNLKDVWEAVTPDDTLIVDFFSDEFTTFHGFHLAFRYMPKACVSGGASITEPQLIALPPWNLQGALPGPHIPGFESSEIDVGIPLLEEISAKPQPRSPRWIEMSSYPQGLNCTWHIDVLPKHLVQVDVLKFHTDDDDVLQIWQLKGEELKPMLKFWSDQIPRSQLQSGSPLLLNFASRISDQAAGSGFLLNVSYISRGCSPQEQKLVAPKGLIAYPSHNLANGQWLSENVIFYGEDRCQWHLSSPEGYTINVTILEFDTRPQDELQVTEGKKFLFKHGGSIPARRQILSSGNHLAIEFLSNGETLKSGFLLQYTWVLKSCQFEITPGEGEIKSPYYPETYGDEMRCQWRLTPPEGHVTQLLIYRLRLDTGDFLQITDGDKKVLLSQDFSNVGLLEFAPSKTVVVDFMSDDSNNRGYFMIKHDIFTPGSCNFSLTSCDYTPVDPLQVWEFKASERMVFVDESVLGIQLPRGYRVKLSSPIIHPPIIHPHLTSNEKTLESSASNMCITLNYVITGEDAFELSVIMEEKNLTQLELSGKDLDSPSDHITLKSDPLFSLHGPHGDYVLTETVNFTAKNPFQIYVTYERGYGPHYRVAIRAVKVLAHPCDGWQEKLTSLSCNFNGSFCGWKNTHMDHQNWQLGERGVSAMANENEGLTWWSKTNKLQQQIADLISPPVTLRDITSEPNQTNLCLELSYQIHTNLAELKVIIVDAGSGGTVRRDLQEETQIWSQGRARSPGLLKAKIPIEAKEFPPDFKLILRGSSVRANYPLPLGTEESKMGISVSNIHLGSGQCEDRYRCDFSQGFCAWKIESEGNTVWHIRHSNDNLDVNSFAAVYSKDVPNKFTEIISPLIDSLGPHTVSFRYHMQNTNQCLVIGILAPSTSNSKRSLQVIWEQCKGKGKHWLHECINLPLLDQEYQVVIRSMTGPENSEVWIDDIVLSAGWCELSGAEHTENMEANNANPFWECNLRGSLCGMTQPVIGLFNWEFYHGPKETQNQIFITQAKSGAQSEGDHSDSQIQNNAGRSVHEPNNYVDNHKDQNVLEFDHKRSQMNRVKNVSVTDRGTDNFEGGQIHQNPSVRFDERVYQEPESLNWQIGQHPGFSPSLPLHGYLCSDGRVLEPSWVCDGVPDCDDQSDEEGCNCGPEGCGNIEEPEIPLSPGICSEGTFRCPSGRICPVEGCPSDFTPCLPRSFLCDGSFHCNEGEDEISCGGVKRNSAPHSLGLEWLGDAPHSMATHSEHSDRFGTRDPTLQTHDAQFVLAKDRFECSGGLFIPNSFRCDGRKDCPLDGLDEVGCYHCGQSQFLCPFSGVCLKKSLVCDGEMSVQECTDEDFCHTCSSGHFACDVCLPSYKVCDGVWDCQEGEDEKKCLGVTASDALASKGKAGSRSEETRYETTRESYGSYPHEGLMKGCQDFDFRCSNDRCLPMVAVCDRKQDCFNAEDENDCEDDNKDVEYYISAKLSSSVFMSSHAANYPSYLITPVLHHRKGAIGLLSFHYRLDAWLGASNATLSVELLDANYSMKSLTPWALWRQSGHKGRLWLQAEVLIPEIPDTDSYRIAFILTSTGVQKRSQQVHLAKISYRMVDTADISTLALKRSTCEFDGTWCGWMQSYTESGYSWVYATASPHARRTGPITGFPDGGTSGFVFADSLHGTEGDATDLLSPPLVLPAKDLAICFRFAIFMYGAHVAKLSVHTIQILPSGHPYTVELFHSAGGKGLSWVPVDVTVDKEALKNPEEPFVLIVRATRGTGPEADIALDHLSLADGRCEEEPKIDPEVLLRPVTTAAFAYVSSLNAGPSFTPFAVIKNHQPSFDEMTNTKAEEKTDHCAMMTSCSECVVGGASLAQDCVWCSAIHSCIGELSLKGRSCHPSSGIFNVAAEGSKTGPTWCPQIISGRTEQLHFIPADSVVALSFPVTNIQARDTESPWTCIFELRGKGSGLQTVRDYSHKHSNLSEVDEPGKDLKTGVSEHKVVVSEDEEIWKQLHKYAHKKQEKAMVLNVPGHFKGTLISSAEFTEEYSKVGVGTITCGDGEVIFTLPKSIERMEASVKIQNHDGKVLDSKVMKVILYRCELLAADCQSCVNLNSTFACGWCAFTQSCTIHTQCTTGLWNSHSHSSSHSFVCNVQEELDFIKNLLEQDEDESDFSDLEEEIFGSDKDYAAKEKTQKGGKRKVKNRMKKVLGDANNGSRQRANEEEEEGEEEDEHSSSEKSKSDDKKRRKKNKGGKDKTSQDKNSIKMGKKGKGRGFLKVPIEPGVFVARDVWRLHTGRQYYVPVSKKTLINLGFVRQVTYGSLSTEKKSRTVLIDGAWKKAAGYYIDLYERADQDPVTSVITTDKKTFEQMLTQLQPE